MDFSIKGTVFRWISHFCKDFESYAGRENISFINFYTSIALAAIQFIEIKISHSGLKKLLTGTLPCLIVGTEINFTVKFHFLNEFRHPFHFIRHHVYKSLT